ncbi:unnamed protein product, partial [Prorocentrum cordatum]
DGSCKTTHAVLEMSGDFRTATVRAAAEQMVFLEEHLEHMVAHSVWVPDWSLLLMGCSGSSDIALFSCHPSSLERFGKASGWVALAPPEGKQLGCPAAVTMDSTTELRGLCFLTSFRGDVACKGLPADTPTLPSPPVVLLAASDGTVSLHFCDYSLGRPVEPARPSAGVHTAKEAAETRAVVSPFAAAGSAASPFGAPAAGAGAASPFAATGPAVSPFGAPAAAAGAASPFATSAGPPASPFGPPTSGTGSAAPLAASSLAGTPFGASAAAACSSSPFAAPAGPPASPFGAPSSGAGAAAPLAAASLVGSPFEAASAGTGPGAMFGLSSTASSPFTAASSGSASSGQSSGLGYATTADSPFKPVSASFGCGLFSGEQSSGGGLGMTTSAQSAGGPFASRPVVGSNGMAASPSSGASTSVSTPAAAAGPSAPTAVDKAQGYKDRIVAVYEEHNPQKVGEVDTLLAKYKGQEYVLYQKICKKYNVPAQPEIQSASGLFGSSQSSRGGLSGSALAQGSGGGLFGASVGPSAEGSLFGSGAAQSSGSGGLFGAGAAQSSGGGMFASDPSKSSVGGIFGTSTGPSAGGGLFGSSAAQSSGSGGLFGTGAAQSSGGGMLGSKLEHSSNGGLFGASTGQSTGGSLFGSGAAQSSGSGSLFGAAQSSGGGMFGSEPAQSSSGGLFSSSTGLGPSTGGSLFGSGAAQSSGSGSLFGVGAAQSSGGLFGGGGSSSGGLGLSTSSQSSGAGLSGSEPAQSSSGGLFGSGPGGGLFSSSTEPNAGGGLFGSSAAQSSGSGGLFGTGAAQSSGGGMFGSEPAQSSSGGLFSSSTGLGPSAGGSLFGSGAAQSSGSGSLFGVGAAQSSGGLFGGGGSSSGGLGLSTSSQSSGAGLSGSEPAQSSSGGLFGSGPGGGFFSSSTEPNAGGGLFGSSAAQGSGSGGLFGTGAAQSSGGLFGGVQSASGSLSMPASSQSFGGLFADAAVGSSNASASQSSGAFESASASGPVAKAIDKVQGYKDRIVAIYEEHNPQKVGEVDALMTKYKGQEYMLYQKICKKYNVPAQPEIQSAASTSGLFSSSTGSSAGGGLVGSSAPQSSCSSSFLGAGGAQSSGGSMFGGDRSSSGGLGMSTSSQVSGGGMSGSGTAPSISMGTAASASLTPTVPARASSAGPPTESDAEKLLQAFRASGQPGEVTAKHLKEFEDALQKLEKATCGHVDKGLVSGLVKDLGGIAAKSADTEKRICDLDVPGRAQILATLSEMQAGTVQHYCSIMSGSQSALGQSSRALQSIEDSCKALEAKMASLEKDMIDKLGGKVDWGALGGVFSQPPTGTAPAAGTSDDAPRPAEGPSSLVPMGRTTHDRGAGGRAAPCRTARATGPAWNRLPPNPLRSGSGRKALLRDAALEKGRPLAATAGAMPPLVPPGAGQDEGRSLWFYQRQAQQERDRTQELRERLLALSQRSHDVESSLRSAPGPAEPASPPACAAPVQKLRKSLYTQLRAHAAAQPRRRAKRSDHLALDRGAFEGLARPPTEIDTPTFGNRRNEGTFGPPSAEKARPRQPGGEADGALMPPPSTVPGRRPREVGLQAPPAALNAPALAAAASPDTQRGRPVFGAGSAAGPRAAPPGAAAARQPSQTPSLAGSESEVAGFFPPKAAAAGAAGLFGGGAPAVGTSAAPGLVGLEPATATRKREEPDAVPAGGAAAQTAPAAPAAVDKVQGYKDRIAAIYQQHNPQKVGEVDALMTKYRGQEYVLYQKICKKYSVPAEPEILDAAAAGASGLLGAPQSGAGGLFGGSQGGGLFASTAGAASALAAPQSAGGLFGAPQSSGGSSSSAAQGGLFGGGQSSSGGLGMSASSQSSGGLFASAAVSSSGAAAPHGFGASASTSAPAVDPVQGYKDRIVAIYQQHNPQKVGEVDALMTKYRGQEYVLYQKICKKYSVPPQPEIQSAAAAAGAGLFGAPQGGAGGLFGGSQGGGLFGSTAGAPAAPQSSGGLFGGGAAQSSGGGLFGGAPAQSSGGGLFGGAPAQSSGGGLFGAAPSAGGGLFGGGAAPAQSSGGGLFGGAPAQSSGGGLFGAEASAGSPFGGGAPSAAFGVAHASPFGGQAAVPGMGAAVGDKAAECRQRITAIYQQYNPTKLGEIENLLVKYRAKEDELYFKICKKYNVQPQPFSGGAPAAGGLSASPFGAPAPAQAATPFGGGMQMQQPLGGMGGFPGAAASGTSPFGAGVQASPFAAPAQPTFGMPSSLGAAPAPFGGAPGMGASPFGGAAAPGASPASPFGGGAALSGCGFGALAQQAPAQGFGAGFGSTPAASPFAAASVGSQWTQFRG